MVRHRQPGSLYGLSHAWLCSYIGDRCLHMIITIKQKHIFKMGDSVRYFRLLLSSNCQLPPRPRQLNSSKVVLCTVSNIHFALAVLFMIVSPTLMVILGKYHIKEIGYTSSEYLITLYVDW